MNLKDFLGVGAPELYWALVLEPGWVEAAIWNIQGEKAQVAAVSPTTAWETDDELLEAVDTALSAAIQNVPEDTKEPNKCVFGVPPSWVSEGQIKEEFLGRIKRICSELSLVPSGFVVLSEAVSHLLKSEEEAPVSAIILEVSKENLELTVFRLGNLTGTTNVARSVSIFDDVVEGLTRFVSADPLPSRIIIYNGKGGELEDLKQELIKSDWNEAEKINFLHTPKVEILDSEKKVMAVCLAGAAEIGNATGVTINKDDNNFPASFEEKPKENQEVEQLKNEPVPTPTPDELQSNIEETDEKTASDLGFVIGGDVKNQNEIKETQAVEENHFPNQTFSKKPSPLSKVGPIVKNFTNRFIGLSNHFKSSPFKSPRGSNKLLLLSVLVLIGLFGLFLVWWFYPKAQVTIFVSPKTLTGNFNLTVDTGPGSSNDSGAKKLAGQAVTVEENGTKSQSTTGSKTVGNAAKGNVEIRNGTANNVNLPAATQIISSSGLVFTLNNSASVSAALSPGNPGTISVDVTAAQIGNAYNLSKDESFKVANYPKADMDALATADFSGGTSQEVTAVSANDQSSLKTALESDLTQKANDDLSSKVSSDKYFLTGSTQISNETSTYSNKVGDQASNLNLDLKISLSGMTVDKNALYEMASSELKDKVPSGYVLRNEQIKINFKPLSTKDGTSQFEADVTANLLPQINTDDIAKSIVGRTPARAQEYLQTVPGFKNAQIKFTHAFPGFFRVLPNLKKNITVELSAN